MKEIYSIARVVLLGFLFSSFGHELPDSTDAVETRSQSVSSSLKPAFLDTKPDLILTGPTKSYTQYGDYPRFGDVNGDGYEDLLVAGASRYNNSQGRLYLYYGGKNMDDKPDEIFTGEKVGDLFGEDAYLADVNGDGYADVVTGALGYNNRQGRVYIFYGGSDLDKNADLILDGEPRTQGAFGLSMTAGDFNNDGYDDVVVCASSFNNKTGRVYLFYGGDPMDTTVDLIFDGENENDRFGRDINNPKMVGDVNGDGYNDLLISTRTWNYWEGVSGQGRAYLYYGGPGTSMDTTCDKTFTGENERDDFGVAGCIFDIDNDGFDDVIIGARRYNDPRGRVYLYWGGKDMDTIADQTFDGEGGSFGCGLDAGYVNGDVYGDFIVAAPYYGGKPWSGKAYLFYGDIKARINTICDKTFTLPTDSDNRPQQLALGDLHNDNYPEVAIGGNFYNNGQGRVWIYYNKPPGSTDEPPISLQEATSAGKVDEVKALISKGVDVNAREYGSLRTALHYAAEKGHKEIAELLIAKGADVNATNNVGDTPLHYAARHDHKDIFQLLVSKGADVDAKNDDGQTPKDIVARRTKTLVSFISAAVMPLVVGIVFAIPLVLSLRKVTGYPKRFFRYFALLIGICLVEYLAVVTAIALGPTSGFVWLLVSVCGLACVWGVVFGLWLRGRSTASKVLRASIFVSVYVSLPIVCLGTVFLVVAIIQGVSVISVEVLAGSPFQTFPWPLNTILGFSLALVLGTVLVKTVIIIGVAGLLIRLGRKSSSGKTKGIITVGAIVLAAGLCIYVIYALFVDAGYMSRGQKANELNESLLQAAVEGDVDEVKSLISKGVYLNAYSWEGTALHIATQYGHEPAVQLLIDAGANVNVEHHTSGDTPLHYAAACGHKGIAELLIKKGANFNSTDALDYTPLHFAASGGHRDIAELLIAKGAEVDAVQAHGLIPLHESAKWGHKDVAELLINSGSNLNAKDKDGRIPLWYAKAGGNEEIVKLLPECGPGHDVAMANMLVPSSCTQEDRVSVAVNVANRSDYSETLTITLTDVTDATTIGTKSVHLSPTGVHGMDVQCDKVFTPRASGKNFFGGAIHGGGDVNGDGYDDLLITGCEWNGGQGRAYLYHGDKNMDNTPDIIFTGQPGDHFGDVGCALEDVNGDGFADVIIGVRGHNNNDGQVHVYHGGANMDIDADVILEGEPGQTGYFGYILSVADIDMDGYEDVLATAPGMNAERGRAYLFYGGDPMSTSPAIVFEGEQAGDWFGRNAVIGEDVDGDGFRDILIGARRAPEGKANGRAYLFYGDPRQKMNAICDMTFTPPASGRVEFGSSLDICDIDNDGYADVVIGSRVYGKGTGAVFIYWGNKREKMDAIADVNIRGEEANSALGGDELLCADFNGDNYKDIVAGAYGWFQSNRVGRAYLYYGGKKDSIDTKPDKVFTGDVPLGCFGHFIGSGDFNKDGYVDFVAGAWGHSAKEGRAFLYYGGPGDSMHLKFDWNTPNASPGEHILKATIDPIAGERDIADNTILRTINIKSHP